MEFTDIVNLLDGREFREADSQIKRGRLKYPNNSAYLCLLIYSAYKQGSKVKAIASAKDFVNKHALNDANSVLLLYRLFSQEGLTKEAQQTYETALRKFPILGPKLLPALIEQMVDGVTPINIKQMEKLLMQLQKVSGETKDVYNAAFACSLMPTDTLLNQLGVKLVEKVAVENTQQLYVVTKLNSNLRQWDAVIDATETFKKKSAEIALDLEIETLYVEALIQSQNWTKLRIHTLPKLTTFNDYSTILNFILALRQLAESFNATKELLDTIPFKRNRLLSYLELAVQYNMPHEVYLQQYYDALKTKLCCFYDIRHYPKLNALKLEEGSNDSHVEINNQKFKLILLGEDYSVIIKENEAIYETACAKKKSLERYELLPENELILMNLLLDDNVNAFEKTDRLHSVLSRNPDDPRVRMWMMHSLAQYGHFTQTILGHFEDLKIKMIQIDTLGYYISNLVPLKENAMVLFNLYRYYLTVPSENVSMVLQGMENQVYTKLEGFFNFYNRSLNSVGELQLALTIAKMTTVLGLSDYSSFFVDRIKTRFQLDLLNDNRDFKTLWKFGINTKEAEAYANSLLLLLTLKLEYYKTLLLNEGNPSNAHSHIKNLNKLLSGEDTKSLNKFETWLYRIYFNLFKCLFKYNQKEMVTNMNYLTKNLKFTKVMPIIGEFSVLSSAYTLLIVSLVELVHNLTGLTDFKHLRDQLCTDIKKVNIRSLVEAELEKTGASKFGFTKHLDNYDILISSLK
ncbi:uncharacterized protein KQ657_004884 [Scheffersomyces spartinae]|uniref:Uncharacterized protein n=1 Tax=Scheffersomyces spartinae TaxID=45513 RepID=A0A9P8AIY5_9ASCO|nr:uncharacterized protein KQ657_004884 [Scheffersomyces spartinae]KAG7194175.1 hypothetical protein KQ657_004884 [Scheffersomyces spartinae]